MENRARIRGLILAVGAVAVAGAVYFGLGSPRPDGADETRTARGAAIVTIALPAQLSGAARLGKRVFDDNCADCHGVNAVGQDGVAPPLVHKIYEPGHHADFSFHRAVRQGVRSHHWRFGDMPPVEGLSDADINHLTRYVRELQRENGIF